MQFGEIIFIIIIAILLFGPDKIPEIARGLGQGMRAMKDASDTIKREIVSQTQDNGAIKDIEDEIQEVKASLDNAVTDANENIKDQIDESINKPLQSLKDNVSDSTEDLNDILDDTFEGPVKRK